MTKLSVRELLRKAMQSLRVAYMTQNREAIVHNRELIRAFWSLRNAKYPVTVMTGRWKAHEN